MLPTPEQPLHPSFLQQGGLRRSALDGSGDRLEHQLRSAEHLVVPEAKHTVALRLEPTLPLSIRALLLEMLRAVDLHVMVSIRARDRRKWT